MSNHNKIRRIIITISFLLSRGEGENDTTAVCGTIKTDCLLVLESRWDQGQGRISSCGGRTNAPPTVALQNFSQSAHKKRGKSRMFFFLEGFPFKLGL